MQSANSGWVIVDGEPTAGDRVRLSQRVTADVVALPTEAREGQDMYEVPPCAYCNHEQSVTERHALAVENAVDPVEVPVDAGVMPADYTLVNDDAVYAFTCHACIADAEVVEER